MGRRRMKSVQVFDGDGKPTTMLGKLLEYVDKLITSQAMNYEQTDREWMRNCARKFERKLTKHYGIRVYDIAVQEDFARDLTRTRTIQESRLNTAAFQDQIDELSKANMMQEKKMRATLEDKIDELNNWNP